MGKRTVYIFRRLFLVTNSSSPGFLFLYFFYFLLHFFGFCLISTIIVSSQTELLDWANVMQTHYSAKSMSNQMEPSVLLYKLFMSLIFSLFFSRIFHIELCHSRPITYLQHLKKMPFSHMISINYILTSK